MKNFFLNKKSTIAVIGFGRFGQLIVKILLEKSKAEIILVSSKKINIKHKNLTIGSINEIKKADLIVPCVPISSFESVIKKIVPFIKKGAAIMDVCSVKTFPVDVMKKNVPESIQIIATHPMFGPDSYRIKKRLDGLKLILWNISAKKTFYEQVKEFFNSLGLKVIELSPKKHDKFLASSLGYSYLLGKINQRMSIKKTPIDSCDFQLLLDHLAIVKNDSEELFFDMQTKNPFSKEIIEKLNQAFVSLAKEIENNRNFNLKRWNYES